MTRDRHICSYVTLWEYRTWQLCNSTQSQLGKIFLFWGKKINNDKKKERGAFRDYRSQLIPERVSWWPGLLDMRWETSHIVDSCVMYQCIMSTGCGAQSRIPVLYYDEKNHALSREHWTHFTSVLKQLPRYNGTGCHNITSPQLCKQHLLGSHQCPLSPHSRYGNLEMIEIPITCVNKLTGLLVTS